MCDDSGECASNEGAGGAWEGEWGMCVMKDESSRKAVAAAASFFFDFRGGILPGGSVSRRQLRDTERDTETDTARDTDHERDTERLL